MVLSFFEGHHAEETRQAIDSEFEKTGLIEKPVVLGDECPRTPGEFEQLLQFLPDSDDDFRTRVSGLSESIEALPRDDSNHNIPSPALLPHLTARPVGESGGAFLTQVRNQLPDDLDEEEEEEEGSEYDPPQFAESGVQPDLVGRTFPTGSSQTGDSLRAGLNSSDNIEFRSKRAKHKAPVLISGHIIVTVTRSSTRSMLTVIRD
jgi:hypothetical protein